MSALPATNIIASTEVDQLREAREILRHVADELTGVAQRLDLRFCDAARLLRNCQGAVVVTGMGKAGLIGRKLAATLSSTGTRALFLHPAEAVHGDLGSLSRGDVVLALSNSGETEEIIRLLPLIERRGVPIVAVTARATSALGRAAAVTLELGHLREAGQFGLAPTTSASAMLAVGDALALIVSRSRGFTREQFGEFHPAGNLGRQLQQVSDLMRSGQQLRIARETATIREVFVSMRKPGRRTGAVMLVDCAGCLTGLFTDSDLVRLLECRRENEIDEPISGAMTVRPKTISPDAPLVDAISLLSHHHISELPVIDESGRPVGLLDITDLIGLMPEEHLE